MSEVTIREVSSKKDLDAFICFNYDLYKGNAYAVPDLYFDLVDTFNPKKNASLEFCEMQLFLAYKDNKVVGRVGAFINKRANETWNVKNVRFGWIDFVDDLDVSKALLDSVAEWGRKRGMTAIQGPLGMTDMDPEGMLIEGFDQLGTMATIYNYPYYPVHMEKYGMEKDADWIEMKMPVPDKVPEKYARVSEITLKRHNLRIKKLEGKKDIFERRYGQKIFDLINEAYAPLFGYSKMTQRQIDGYVNTYMPLVDLRMVTLVEDCETNEVVAVGISMPSIVRALQKANGHLFPFGWFHLLKSLKWKHEEGVELLLVAVKPEYQNKGVNALLFADLIPIYQKMGFKWAETNPQLELNVKGQAQWQYLDHTVPKRRRCFRKDLY
ncbi:MAG: N-acetyltransferase [Bacteroidaceae bacterium]|nr:N-acetyltransferase [Bacteroidaceae bacterium]